MNPHPAANIFPLLEGDDFNALKADIALHGQLEPIVLYQGQILDGRNRFHACRELGMEPVTREWDGSGSPVEFVTSLNMFRRHLNKSQRAFIALAVEQQLAAEAKDKEAMRKSTSQIVEKSEPIHAAEQAAQVVGTNRQYIADAKFIRAGAPELEAKVLAGEMNIPKAKAMLKKQDRIAYIEEQKAQIAQATPIAPQGLFNVIVIDPPWSYNEGDPGKAYNPNHWATRVANPYPEMTLDEIADLRLPAAEDCVLWLWTTHKFMRHSFALLDVWGFEDKTILTWVKDRMGVGYWLRSQSEYCIMAVKGNPPINLTNQTTVLHGPMREHSRKPDEFYALVDGLCVGRKIDFFSRECRPGWAQYGNEPEKFVNRG